VLPEETVNELLGDVPALGEGDIQDADVIEDDKSDEVSSD
jgi:hypothetical protein